VDVVALLMVTKPVRKRHDLGRGEGADANPIPAHHQHCGVVSAGSIAPEGRPHQTAIAKIEVLAPDANADRPVLEIAEIHIGAAQVPGALVRRRAGLILPERGSVLKLCVDVEPWVRLDQRSHPESG